MTAAITVAVSLGGAGAGGALQSTALWTALGKAQVPRKGVGGCDREGAGPTHRDASDPRRVSANDARQSDPRKFTQGRIHHGSHGLCGNPRGWGGGE